MDSKAPDRWLQTAFAAAGLAVVYFALGKLGLSLAVVHPSATAVWPPSGLALAAILLLGYRVWPGIFLGAFAVNLTTTGSVLTVLGISAGNTLEALAGAWLVERFAGGRRAFDSPRNSLMFAALAGGVSTIIAATFGSASLTLTGYAESAGFGQLWLTWWLGDATGDLLTAPLVILWASAWPIRWQWRPILEGALSLALLVFAGMAVLRWATPENRAYLLMLVWTPILHWTAFRIGRLATATAAVVLSSLAAGATFSGVGLFVNNLPNASLLLLQTYIATATILALAVAATVWERQQVQVRLRNREVELARRNEELERFAYAARHDLQEPLRTIALFTQAMVEEHHGKLGSQADRYMDYVVGGVNRMKAMIQSIFDYSGLSRGEQISFSRLNLDEIVELVLKNLAASIAETGTRVTVDKLPEIRGNQEQLMSLFQILIDNAIRYRSAGAPEVHIRAQPRGGDWIVVVQDNGVGIEPQYHEKIFQVFTRLQGAEIQGTGNGPGDRQTDRGDAWGEAMGGIGEGARGAVLPVDSGGGQVKRDFNVWWSVCCRTGFRGFALRSLLHPGPWGAWGAGARRSGRPSRIGRRRSGCSGARETRRSGSGPRA